VRPSTRLGRACARFAGLCLLLALGACGGGGGSGGPTLGLSLSPASVQGTFLASSAYSFSVRATVQGTVSGTVFVVIMDPAGVLQPTVQIQQQPDGSYIATLTTQTGLAAGQHSGSLQVQLCGDQACAHQYGGASLAYDFTVLPVITVAPASVTLNGVEGATTSKANALTLSYQGGNTPWSASVSYVALGQSWLSVTPSSGSTFPASLELDAASLQPGSYSATVTISYNTPLGAASVQVPVQYQVIQALASTAAADVSIDEQTTRAGLAQSVTLSSNRGDNIPWSASSSASWLQLAPAQGDTAGSNHLTLTVDYAALAAMPPGTLNATVTITPQVANTSTVTLSPKLNMRLPLLRSIGPHNLAAGNATPATLRGIGFSGLSPLDIVLGTAAATNVAVSNDTTLSLTTPALAAGSYSVNVLNALGLQRGPANAWAAAPAGLPAATVIDNVYPPPSRLIYDPARATVYGVSQSYGCCITRYRYDGSAWHADSLSPFQGNVVDLAESPNGDKLLAVSVNGVSTIDPASFTITRTSANPFTYSNGNVLVNYQDLQYIGIDNNLYAYITLLPSNLGNNCPEPNNNNINNYDTTLQDGPSLSSAELLPNSYGVLYSSGNFNSLFDFEYQYQPVNPPPSPCSRNNYHISPNPGGSDNNVPQTVTRAASIDADGSRTIVDNVGVYGSGSTTPLGILSSSSAIVAAAISYDGHRAYTLNSAGTLEAFNLDSPDGHGGFTATGNPLTISGAAAPMIISPDGLTLFMAGSSNGGGIVVSPHP